MKKTISIFLAVLMLVTMFPLSAFAMNKYYEGLVYRIINNEIEIVDCNDLIKGEVSVPAYINDYQVKSIGDYAFMSCDNIISVNLPDGLESIGAAAFFECRKLESINIPPSVNFIGTNAFYSCNVLSNISLPDSITEIGDGVFTNCNFINDDVLKNILTENITSIGESAFFDCNEIESIIFPDSILSIGEKAFYDCDNLKDVILPESLININPFTFFCCRNLASITIPDSVTTISDFAFSDCYSLETVYYLGTEEQWNSIKIGSNNKCLTNANIIFNSSSLPNQNDPAEPTITVTPFSVYFADYLKDYTSKIANVDMPCEALIAAGGMPSLTWNTVVESIKSLTNFKLGIDEKGYYEAILLDLLANTVTSVDYDKVMTETTKEMANMLTNYLVDKNVDVTKEKLDSLDLKNLQNNLQDYLTASNIQITKESFDALIDGTESAAECLDKISTYAIAMQEGQHLVSALKLMAHHSDNQPLTDCLNELSVLMTTTPEKMAKIVTAKETVAKTSQVVGDYILDVIKSVFPFEQIKEIVTIAKYGSDLIFPVSTTSEEMFRIYTLYHIEDVTKASFKTASNNYNSKDTIANAENVVSCYDMIVRVYEHQIEECNALAELLYKKGFLNAVKNFFSSNSEYDYQNALDWVDAYNVGLDRIKSYKQTAYNERGLSLGLLQPVRFVGIADGKIMGYREQFVETGSYVSVPDYKTLNRSKFSQRLGTFEGWFYDEECTTPVWAKSIQVNKPLVLYSKISTKSVKQLQIKCPVNVEIYDDSNNMLLKIENDVLVQNDADFVVMIEGTQKCVLLPYDENYNIKISATDFGTMNYSITEIENGSYARRINFYDISLYDGQEFFGNIESGLSISQSDYTLSTKTIDNKPLEINPDETLEKNEMQQLNISVNCIGNGTVSGNTLVTQGDYCTFDAIPNENYVFDGWYSGNELLSSDKHFGFIAKESMTITAIFNSEDTKCDHLNFSEFNDDQNHWKQCLDCDVVFDVQNHEYSDWVVIKAPTTVEEGIKERTCIVCEKKEVSIIEKHTELSGDLNGDGNVTAADARVALRISAKLDTPTQEQFMAADVNGDGRITASDARTILRVSAKLETL